MIEGTDNPPLTAEERAAMESKPTMNDLNDDRRRSGWIQTFTGRRIYPANPKPDDIDIRDIAHALSMQCRFGGHCLRFYSVAEHCVLLARHMPSPLALWALLHDASEAYLVDVPRPIKPMLVGYYAIETALQTVINQRFGLVGELPEQVKVADSAILGTERVNLSKCEHAWAELPPALPITLRYWTPEQAEIEFLTLFFAVAPLRMGLVFEPSPLQPRYERWEDQQSANNSVEAMQREMDERLPTKADT